MFLDVFYQVKFFCHVFGNSCNKGLTLVRPDVITSFNMFHSTQGSLHADSYLL
jgi:hypothetical protein